MIDKKFTVCIRADGNPAIGMGHLMRCMSIAKALQKQGAESIFVTACREAAAFLEDRGFANKLLDADYRDMEAELPLLKPLLEKEKFSLFLADSYQITQGYLDAVRAYCPVVYLDDMGTNHLTADGLINYNITGKNMGYSEWCPKDMKLILGAEFAPVKEQFVQTPYEVREKVCGILITMGGSDTLNIAGRLGEQLLKILPPDIELDIICGRFNPHLETLQEMQAKDSRIHILVDVQDMWNKMAAADIAVSAAGSTMYELSTMGVPTVCCYYVENQRRIAECFAEQVQMVNAGDFSADSETVCKKMTEEIIKLVNSCEAREALSKRMKSVTDGRGAEHMAEALAAFV